MVMRKHTGRRPCDWGYAAAIQGMPKIASKPPETKKRQRRIPIQVSEGAWPW